MRKPAMPRTTTSKLQILASTLSLIYIYRCITLDEKKLIKLLDAICDWNLAQNPKDYESRRQYSKRLNEAFAKLDSFLHD